MRWCSCFLTDADGIDFAMQAREIQREALKALFAKDQLALMANEMLSHPNCTHPNLMHAWTAARDWAASRHPGCDDWDRGCHAQFNSAQLLGLHWEANLLVSQWHNVIWLHSCSKEAVPGIKTQSLHW